MSDVAGDVEQHIKCSLAFPTLPKEEDSSSLYGVSSHVIITEKGPPGLAGPRDSLEEGQQATSRSER